MCVETLYESGEAKLSWHCIFGKSRAGFHSAPLICYSKTVELTCKLAHTVKGRGRASFRLANLKSSCDDASRLKQFRSLWRWGNTGELRSGRRKWTLATLQMLSLFTTVMRRLRQRDKVFISCLRYTKRDTSSEWHSGTEVGCSLFFLLDMVLEFGPWNLLLTVCRQYLIYVNRTLVHCWRFLWLTGKSINRFSYLKRKKGNWSWKSKEEKLK